MLRLPSRCLRQFSQAGVSLLAAPGPELRRHGSRMGSSGTVAGSTQYPEEPRVGVGVVVLREATLPGSKVPEVLVIKRGKEPNKGSYSLPGGSLELGESLVDCAVREVAEETGVQLRNGPPAPGAAGVARSLSAPRVFTAVDSIWRDAGGRIAFHYAIVEVAGTPVDPLQAPVPADDVDEAAWVPHTSMAGMPRMTEGCPEVVLEAVQRFAKAAEQGTPGSAERDAAAIL